MTEALGVLGFAISLVLGAVKLWETFFRKSRFEADIHWASSPDSPVLEVAIANVGWKKDSVRALHFRTRFPRKGDPHQREWLEWQIAGPTWGDVPMVLDVDEVTPRQELPVNELPYARLGEELLEGGAELVLENARGRKTTFPIKKFGDGPPPPEPDVLQSNDGNS